MKYVVKNPFYALSIIDIIYDMGYYYDCNILSLTG